MTKLLLSIVLLALALPTSGAEFLIDNHTNYWDTLTAKQVSTAIFAGRISRADYDRRSQPGDVIDVKPDGFWTGPNPKYKSGPELDTKLFRIVRVPGLSVADAQKYVGPGTTAKHKYRITAGAGEAVYTISDSKNLSVTDKDLVAQWKQRVETTAACTPGGLLLVASVCGFCRYRRR